MRVLLVEDEMLLRAQVDKYLRDAGFVVDMAPDGEKGLYFGLEFDYDVAVIDLGLPKMNGIDLIAALRQQNRAFPILILTARRDWQDKVAGLEAGADDYLTKPFHLEELKARLNALIRRAAGYASPVVEKGPLSLDLGAKEARLHGEALELTAFEYRVLEYLVMNPARVVSKGELTEHLYEQDFDRDSNVIEVFIGRLRRKLDPDGTLNPIRTIRGAGYRFSL